MTTKGQYKRQTQQALIHSGGMLTPDADIILAILEHKRKSGISSDCIHALSHQDKKKKRIYKETREREKINLQKELQKRIREVDVGLRTHAPTPESSPLLLSPTSPAQSLSSESTSHTKPKLADKVLMNVACDKYMLERQHNAISFARKHLLLPYFNPHAKAL